ncbi:MAG: hypothetical protein ACPGSB_06415, partial [Opitutales bacterium]
STGIPRRNEFVVTRKTVPDDLGNRGEQRAKNNRESWKTWKTWKLVLSEEMKGRFLMRISLKN